MRKKVDQFWFVLGFAVAAAGHLVLASVTRHREARLTRQIQRNLRRLDAIFRGDDDDAQTKD